MSEQEQQSPLVEAPDWMVRDPDGQIVASGSISEGQPALGDSGDDEGDE